MRSCVWVCDHTEKFQLDVKLGQIMEEVHDAKLKKIKNKKVAGFHEIPP